MSGQELPRKSGRRFVLRALKRVLLFGERPSYPYWDGDVQVLGPGVIANKYGDVINWRGEHFERKPER